MYVKERSVKNINETEGADRDVDSSKIPLG